MRKKENTEIKENSKKDIQNLDKINRRSFFVVPANW